MKNTLTLLLITLFMGTWLNAQVKIGDNPQNIDPSSVLELESTDKVLVITRITTVQMNAIVPSQGALCYNTDLQAVHFYDGTQWVNIGSSGTGDLLTADPIVNDVSTIVITPTATGDNLEVAPNSISSAQIIDGGVNGVDIQDDSIGPGKLQNNSVTEEKLSENSVGAFALDNDNIGVSAFNNDVGYITAGDLNSSVSGDTPNSITVGSDGGAYYDDTNLMNDVLDNAMAIAMDDDQSSANEIQNPELNGTLLGLTLTGGTVDLGPLISAGGSDDQNIGPISINPGNILSIGIENGLAGTVDLSSLAGGGGSTEVVDGTTLTGVGTVGDPFKIEPAATFGRFLSTDATGNVLWADLPTGSGGTVISDGATIIGNGLAGSELQVPAGGITFTEIANATILGEDLNQMTATDGQVLTWDNTAANWIPADSGGGVNQNLGQVLTQGNDGGAALIKNILNPVDPQDAATRAYVDAAVTSGGGLTDGTILIGDALNTPQQLAVSGDATMNNTGVITISDNVINTDNIENSTILLEDLAQNGASDGKILKWNNTTLLWELADDDTGTATLTDGNIFVGGTGDVPADVTMSGDATIDNTGAIAVVDDAIMLNHLNQNGAAEGDVMLWDNTAGEWIVNAPPGEHSGTPMSLFYADATTGLPTTAFNINNGDIITAPSLVWDQSKRFNSGALGIGLDGGPQSDVAKVHIMEGSPDPLDFPLQIQKQNGSNNVGVGVLFAVEAAGNFGKGSLALERTGAWGVGDFHFLQNNVGDASLPTLADKSFTIKNNKDIVIYGGIDIDGIGLGAAGEVLTSTGTLVEWAAAGGTSTLNNGNIFVGNASNAATSVTMSGDAQIDITGAVTIQPNVIESGEILDGTIVAADLANMGAANNEILKWNGTGWAPAADVAGTPMLNNGNIFVGNASNTATSVVMSGDAQIDNTGVLTVQPVAIENGMLDKANIPLSGFGIPTADISMGTFKITNLVDPTFDQEAATKKYVDDNAGIGTLSQNNILLGDVSNNPQKVALSTVPISALGTASADLSMGGFQITNLLDPTADQDAATKKYVDDNAGANLFSTNLTLANQRTHDLGGNNLILGGSGDVAIGTLPGAPISKLDVNGQISARNGFASSQGSAGIPAYSFYTNGDSNTGMFRPNEDQIGFSTAGVEAARIDGTGPAPKVIINQSLQLDGTLLDATGLPGTAGQILSSTATGTQWSTNPTVIAMGKIGDNGAVINATAGVTTSGVGGIYFVTLNASLGLTDGDYIINATILSPSTVPKSIIISNQTQTGFTVNIVDSVGSIGSAFFFTVTDL